MKHFTIFKTFVLVAAVILTMSTLYSQVPQYNTGPTAVAGGNSIPFSFMAAGVKGQGLYPVGVFGTPPTNRHIKKVYWMPAVGQTGTVTYAQLHIRLGQANIASLTTTYHTPMTPVFSAQGYTLNYSSGQWFGFTLPTPFPYNPALPLIWEVDQLHQTFVTFYNNVVSPNPVGAWRNYSYTYNAAVAIGAGAYMISFGFDLVQVSNGPNDAGVDAITEPTSSCVGTVPVKARIKNFGKNKIDSVRVHWSVNAVPQTPVMYRQQMDTNGTATNTAIITLGNVTFVNSVPVDIVAWTEKPNNITDTVYNNDTSDVSFIGRAYPVVKLGNDTSRCPTDAIILNAGSGMDSVKWSTSATTQTISVTTPATYSVKVYKYGCMGGDTIVIGTFPAAPNFSLGPDTTFCFGQSFLLNGPTGTGLTYLWQDNTTNSTYLVDTSGTYTLTVSTVNNCKKSDSKLVKLFTAPTVSMVVKPTNTLCYGTPYYFQATPVTSGSIMYQWKVNGANSGAPTSSNTFTPNLNYGDSVSVDLITDLCSATPYPVPANNWITMFLKPIPILINGIMSDLVVEQVQKNYAIGIKPGSTYSWKCFGGNILGDTTISAITVKWGNENDSAWLRLRETDAGGCSYNNVLPVKIVSTIGIDEKSQVGVGFAYPNPADQTVNIPVYVKSPVNLSLTLHDITGKKVMDIHTGMVDSDKVFEIPTAQLKEGMYFYKFTTSDGAEMVRKLAIRH